MQTEIFKDYNTLSAQVAYDIIKLVKNNPQAVLCLASGDTPKLAAKILAERGTKEKVDFSRSTFVGLDEWLRIPPDNEGSCHYFFKNLIFDPLGFSKEQVHLFDALTNNPKQECRKMDELIFNKGGIDLMIVGIGMNGHIGFNEPGTSFENYSHVADLDDTTRTVGQKYFNKPMELNKGITIGLKHLLESKKVILMANGSKKAEVIRKATTGPVDAKFPASIIQRHSNGVVMVDQEAAALLSKNSEVGSSL